MYVTRPLSLYKKNPEAANEPPPRGPGSGYLVIQDQEYEAEATCCFGLCRDVYLRDLPFPQDRRLTIEDSMASGDYQYTVIEALRFRVYFIPVIDLPLSSNRYYIVVGKGKHEGKVSTSSTVADTVTHCFCRRRKDVEPRQFDYGNGYQQVEVIPYAACLKWKGSFYAKSVVHDGFPQSILRRKGWRIYGSTRHFQALGDALGINGSLRARKPGMDFAGACSPPVIVGKWYCPFIFVREEEMPIKEQVKKNLFYEMLLEQFWEEVYVRENSNHAHEGNAIRVCASIQSERPSLHLRGDEEEVRDDLTVTVDEGVKWFRPREATGGGVGLDAVIVKRMRWEVERVGWIAGKDRVDREEEEYGVERKVLYGWKKFKCYVLVERFALKRMDGTLLLTYDFKYANEVRSKWE